MEESPFLTQADLDTFETRFRLRQVRPAPANTERSANAETAEEAPQELVWNVTTRLDSLRRHSERWFACLCIAVRGDDGMSWSAEALRRQISLKYPEFSLRSLVRKETPEAIPHVAQLIGERALLKAAAREKLVSPYLSLFPSRLLLWLAALAGLGVLVVIGDALLKLRTSSPSPSAANQFLTPGFWLLAAALTGASVLSKRIGDKFASGQKEKSIDQLAGNLRKAESDKPGPYRDFIDRLARELRSIQRPCVVIIDNFERLDSLTRAVVQRYFYSYCDDATGSDFWIVFEGQDGTALSRVVRSDPQGLAFAKTNLVKQLALSDQILREISLACGRSDATEFSTVKWACRGAPADDSAAWVRFKEYRQDHPVREDMTPGDLEYFYFLTMAASHREVTFNERTLFSMLSTRTVERFKIFESIFANANLSKTAITDSIRRAVVTFPALVGVDARLGDRFLTFSPEHSQLLEKHSDLLGLPDSGLVHWYWAVFWYDQAGSSKTPDADLLRRLSHHVLKADISKSPETLAGTLEKKLFDVLVYAITASVRVCLFRDLRKLLERAVELFENSEFQESSRHRLIRCCWDSYTVLGDPGLIALVVRSQPPLPLAETPAIPIDLADLFLAFIPLAPDLRKLQMTTVSGWQAGKSKEGQAAYASAVAHAGWFLASIIELVPWSHASNTLLGGAFGSRGSLERAFHQTCQRVVTEKSELPMLTDVMTITHCLWSNALLDRYASATESISSAIGMSEEALILAAELETRTFGPNMEVVLNGLTRELCAVSLASLLAAYKSAATREALSDKERDQVQRVIQEGLSLFGSINEGNLASGFDLDSTQLAEQIDALLSLCAVIWSHLELEMPREFSALRRLQFNVICRGFRAVNYHSSRSLIDSVSPGLSTKSFTGILANCVVATCYKSAEVLEAHFLVEAASTATTRQYDTALQSELAMLAIRAGNTFGLDLDPFLQVVLQPGPDGTPFIRVFFEAIPESRRQAEALALLNAARPKSAPGLVPSVQKVILDMAESMPEPDRTDILFLLEFHKTRHLLARENKGIDLSKLLDPWASRRDTWLYAAVLQLVIAHKSVTMEVWTEAYALLHRDAEADLYNSYLLLAIDLGGNNAGFNPTNAQRSILTRYLEKGMQRWEPSLPPEINLRGYKLLYRLQDRRSEWVPHVTKWEKVKIEWDHRKRLRQLADQKRYLLLFHDYCESASFWGLDADAPEEELREFNVPGSDFRTRIWQSWLDDPQALPQPLVSVDGEQKVSSRFLWLGELFFSPPRLEDSQYESERTYFNEAARKSLTNLMKVILRLKEMPEEIRDLLGYHSDQLFAHANLVQNDPGHSRRSARRTS